MKKNVIYNHSKRRSAQDAGIRQFRIVLNR